MPGLSAELLRAVGVGLVDGIPKTHTHANSTRSPENDTQPIQKGDSGRVFHAIEMVHVPTQHQGVASP